MWENIGGKKWRNVGKCVKSVYFYDCFKIVVDNS
jgi:hypothetical protein